MGSLDALKDHIHDVLIEYDGDIRLDDHPDIMKEAREAGLDERQLSKLIQDVYSTINWDVVKKQKEDEFARLEALKKANAIARSNTQPAAAIQKRPVQQTSRNNVNSPGSSQPTSRASAITAVVLLLGITAFIGYAAWLKPYLKDKNATRMYSYANTLVMRSSPSSGADYNTIGNLSYGTEILVYSFTSDWANGKANGTTGYVSTQFLLNKKDFHELNAIFADDEAKEIIKTTKCRKALLSYFTTKGIMGKMDPELQKEIYGEVQNKEVWQVFVGPKNNTVNNVAYPKIVNARSKFSDFACVIKNIESGKRRLLLFSFDDLENPTLVMEKDAPDQGYIKSVKSMYINGSPDYYVTYVN